MRKSFLLIFALTYYLIPYAVWSDQGMFSATAPAFDVPFSVVNGTAVFEGKEYFISEEPGSPGLPVYNISFILPENADENSIQINIVNPTVSIENNIYVKPVAPYIDDPVDSTPYWPEGVIINEDGENVDIYENLNDWVYDDWVLKTTVTGWKSVKIVRAKIAAFNWHPTNLTLKKLTGGNIVLSYTIADEDDTSIALPHFSPETAKQLYPILANAQNGDDIIVKLRKLNKDVAAFKMADINTYFSGEQNTTRFKALMQSLPDIVPNASQGDVAELYIITTEDIFENTVMFEKFISSKCYRGFNVTVVTEHDTRLFRRDLSSENFYRGGWIIPNAGGWWNNSFSGIERAEMIRSYLTETLFYGSKRYEEMDHLLLIGNPHPGTCSTDPTDPAVSVPCIFDGTSQGNIPMKWINIAASEHSASLTPDDLSYAVPTDKYYSLLRIDWPVDTIDGAQVVGDFHNGSFYEDSTKDHDLVVGRIPIYPDPADPLNNPDYNMLNGYFQRVIKYENLLKYYVPSDLGMNEAIEQLRRSLELDS